MTNARLRVIRSAFPPATETAPWLNVRVEQVCVLVSRSVR